MLKPPAHHRPLFKATISFSLYLQWVGSAHWQHIFNTQHGRNIFFSFYGWRHSLTISVRTTFFFFSGHTVNVGEGQMLPKALVKYCKLEKWCRMDTSPNWFQGMKTCLAAQEIWLVTVPVMTRRQGYHTKMTESHFILRGFTFPGPLISAYSCCHSFFVGDSPSLLSVTHSQGWKAKYDKMTGEIPDKNNLDRVVF